VTPEDPDFLLKRLNIQALLVTLIGA